MSQSSDLENFATTNTTKPRSFKLAPNINNRKMARVNLVSVEKTAPLKRRYRRNHERYKNLNSRVYNESKGSRNLVELDLHFKDSTITINLKKPQKRFFNSLILTQKVDITKKKNLSKVVGYLPKLFNVGESGEIDVRNVEVNKEMKFSTYSRKRTNYSFLDSKSFHIANSLSYDNSKRSSQVPINLKMEKFNQLITKDKSKAVKIKKKRRRNMMKKRRRVNFGKLYDRLVKSLEPESYDLDRNESLQSIVNEDSDPGGSCYTEARVEEDQREIQRKKFRTKTQNYDQVGYKKPEKKPRKSKGFFLTRKKRGNLR